MTYTLTVSNAGPSVASGVVVTDEMPKGTSYNSGSGADCSKVARTVICSLSGQLGVRASTDISLVFGIGPEVTGLMTNTAEVGSDAGDDVSGNNLGSALVTVDAEADKALVELEQRMGTAAPAVEEQQTVQAGQVSDVERELADLESRLAGAEPGAPAETQTEEVASTEGESAEENEPETKRE